MLERFGLRPWELDGLTVMEWRTLLAEHHPAESAGRQPRTVAEFRAMHAH